MQVLVAEQKILNKIYAIRGEKVMLDQYLAEMYGVETKQLKRQVKRNIARFPKDFMFELSVKEFENLSSQIGTSRWGGTRNMPMAHKDILIQLSKLEKEVKGNSKDIENIFIVLKELIEKHIATTPRNKIGFKQYEKND